MSEIAEQKFLCGRCAKLFTKSFMTMIACEGLFCRGCVELIEAPHPEDYCHRCGGPNISWFAPNEMWNSVVRDNNEPEILCPICFAKLVEQRHGFLTWHISPRD